MTGMYVNTPPRPPPLSILSVEIDFSFAEQEIVSLSASLTLTGGSLPCRYSVSVKPSNPGEDIKAANNAAFLRASRAKAPQKK